MIETDKKVITRINWETLDIKSISLSVRKLHNRIVKAKKAGRTRMVKKLQTLLVKSLSARILAVKRVSENRGKNSAGVDGKLLNTDVKKDKCVYKLKFLDLDTYRAQPLKRVEIPKKNGAVRPLGIPTMFDRTLQALYKLALEPIAEVVADINSYGFRTMRSTQDAMKHIHSCTSRKDSKLWVLEADIKGCFDNISHNWIYENIPLDNRLLKQWLKSGFIKDGKLFPTNSGTLQGGIISPVLANMVLDGIEDIVRSHRKVIRKVIRKVTNGVEYRKGLNFNFIRYADDFVVIGDNPKVLRALQRDIEQFLKIRGLTLSKEKTKISNIYDGFDFLGFNFKKYAKGKLLIRPAKDSIKSFKSKIKEIFKKYRANSVSVLIAKLNPIIRGWGNYYRFVNSKAIFSKLDQYIWYKSLNWIKRVHQHRGIMKYYDKYFKNYPNHKSVTLSDGKKQVFILKSIPIRRHIKIRAEANPFDKCWDTYFTKRLSKPLYH